MLHSFRFAMHASNPRKFLGFEVFLLDYGRLLNYFSRFTPRFGRLLSRFSRFTPRFGRLLRHFSRFTAHALVVCSRFSRFTPRFGRLLRRFSRFTPRFGRLHPTLVAIQHFLVVSHLFQLISIEINKHFTFRYVILRIGENYCYRRKLI